MMDNEEAVGWRQYFAMLPTGWREDSRTLKLMQIQGFDGQAASIFPSLERVNALQNSWDTENSAVNSLRASPFFAKMLESKKGKSLGDIINEN